MCRIDGRSPDQLREITILPGFMEQAHGSALIKCGRTQVICTATLEERVPPFLKDTGSGWLTAEYAMLPASTHVRKRRENLRHGADGRSVEIQRLIGRSLRAGFDLKLMPERTLTIDCDVISADGGTRTASITGGFVAASLAIHRFLREGALKISPILRQVAAVSAGIVGNQPMLDLCYEEDSRAQCDFNIVMTSDGDFIEVQGSAEGAPFSRDGLEKLLCLGEKGVRELMEAQRAVIAGVIG